MPPKKVYTKKDPIDHVLLRTSMYAGSKTLKTYDDYVAEFDDETGEYRIIKKYIKASPAVLRIFIEVLSNAVDNVDRSRKAKIPCTMIKVNINQETGETVVWNDGDIIPIELHADEKMHNHTLIFGHLLTGSNYDDTDEREVSGLNGLGTKVTNIFSTKFTVKGLDPINKKTFEQTWTNNMKSPGVPIIKATKEKKGYTEVRYFPDFKQFDLEGYTNDIIGLYTKYVIDAAMLTKVKVYFNNDLINVNNLLTYSKLYDLPTDEHLLIKYENIEALITPSNEFQSIAFSNGIFNRLGGQHIDSVSEALFRPMLEKFNKKGKPQLNIKDIKQFFKIFVTCVVPNPEYDSQSKERLEAPKVKFEIKSVDVNKILKWSVITDIEDMLKAKEMIVLKKSEKKKKSFVKIDGYDAANNAGGKLGHECSLILCEGLSAKNYGVAGIEKGVDGKKGRDFFGIMALSGKILNCRNSIPTTIANNKVITNLIQALNLRHDIDYTEDSNYKTLSYGKVILMTDSDVDGLHITGLIMNLFHYLFPSLLGRGEPFLVNLATPIVIVKKPIYKIFYDENRYKQFQTKTLADNKKIDCKYYKGLGTFEIQDVPDTFGEKIVNFIEDDKTNTLMNKVFHKKFADQRKDWLENYNQNPVFSLDDQGKDVDMDISTFLDTEVIKFSHNDCKRSIPSLFDGLKESQRKILFCIKKRNLTFNKQMLKVAQLGAYTAEHSNYHHGEGNLFDTIINMAQEFPGANNIPLLYRGGMFGTRACPSGAASPRYIFTKMETITPLIFRPEDDVLLEYVIDDGDQVEPKFYIPILPMILVNGSVGIGSGWSTNIPCFNPLDIIKCIHIWLDNDGDCIIEDPDDGNIVSLLPELIPWYRGFTGRIESSKDKYITYGTITKNKNKVEVTELPIGLWTDKFKETCEDWRSDKQIKDFKNYSDHKKIKFTITESDDGMNCNLDNMKLQSTISLSNMVVFNEKEQLKKYTVDQIINDFCKVRYEFYTKRKNYIINNLEKDLKFMGNKARFIQEIIDKKLNIMNVDEEVLIKDLEKKGYDKDFKNTEDNSEESNKSGYEYLLRLQVRTFTANKVKQLKDDILSVKNKLADISKISEKQMWMRDLKEFEVEYVKWLKTIDAEKKPKIMKK